jgi:small subunit ribosomal protein S16
VFDSRTRRDGPSIEDIGTYDTKSNREKSVSDVKLDRARFWLSKGALPSDTVRQIFKRNGVYSEAGETAEASTS